MIKSRKLRWAGYVARMEEGMSALKIVTGKHRGKIPLEIPRRIWKDDIRKDLKEIGINTRNWVDSVQDRDYWKKPCECEYEPPGCISHGINIIEHEVKT